jgi:hypothetical protein
MRSVAVVLVLIIYPALSSAQSLYPRFDFAARMAAEAPKNYTPVPHYDLAQGQCGPPGCCENPRCERYYYSEGWCGNQCCPCATR